MANAPNGAVSTIARTATVSTRSPQVKPNASGIPPIAAWTVAFGVYASIVNSLSLDVYKRQALFSLGEPQTISIFIQSSCFAANALTASDPLSLIHI